MRVPLSQALVALVIMGCSCLPAEAELATPLATRDASVRALGMGDAFTALSADDSALFYNPAGLVRVRGLNLKIFSLRAGLSGLSAYSKLTGLTSGSSSGLADAIEELYGEHVSILGGGEVAFTAPMLGFAVYDHLETLVHINNPVYPDVYTSVINDYGYVMGLGVPLGPFLHAGMNFRYVKRTGTRMPLGAGAIADLNSDELYGRVTRWGKGYGADLGLSLNLPAPFFSATVSAVWKNMGRMSFRTDTVGAEIPFEENEINIGAALRFDTPVVSVSPAVDVRRLNDPSIQLIRKINFGVEVDLPLLDIRGGFHEGYYTYGLGVNLGLFRVDAATYGVELGDYPGQIEDRRYVLEFAMEIGVGGFGVSGASSGSSGGTAGQSSKSIWGGQRLKQRR